MRNRYELGCSTGTACLPTNRGSLDDDNQTKRSSIHSVSVIIAFVVALFLLALYAIAYAIYGILPNPLKLSDEANYPDSFIAERAQADLKLLTDLGPRVLGSYENEVLSVDILTREIGFIQQQANRNLTIDLDVQVVTGAYFLGYKPNGIINAYSNVQNVIVKVHARNDTAHSILVNAHFDSVPTSPGGSDDGINCAVMLEVLRKFSRSSEPPRHNIIFLFNGAEEAPLQAAHGFISQHKWASSVKIVVNLEAAGAGGKIILFQTGPNRPWLMKYYSKVPHPVGSATGEELFQSGAIPSDTDFRIFRDFGNTIGFDMAFVDNGFRYHTKFDGFSNIPLGSFQHAGDNTLSLIRNLAEAPEIDDLEEQSLGKVTFFDVFGLFLVSYNNTINIVINVLVAALSILTCVKAFRDFELGVSKQTFKYLGIVLGAILSGWILAGIFVSLISLLFDLVNFTMSWYANPWIIFGLYCFPTVAITALSFIVLNTYFTQRKWCISIQSQIQSHVIRLIWTVALLIGTILSIRSMFFLMIPIGFHSLTFLVIHLLKLHHSVNAWKLIYVFVLAVPTLFLMHYTIMLFSFIVPICGRIGNNRNPEIIIALLAMFFTIFITCFYVPLISVVRKPILFVAACFAVFMIAFIIVFTPLGFPYSGNEDSPKPQRFYIYHTSRVFHNETDIVKSDSGFFFYNLDRNSPSSVKNYITELDNSKSIADDCDVTLFCGLPIFSIRLVPVLRESIWIPAGKPVIHEPIQLTVNSKENLSATSIRYNVTAAGPDHGAIYLSPKQNVNLTNMNGLLNETFGPTIEWNGRPTYVILHTYGKEKAELNFEFVVEVPQEWKNSSTVDIAVTGSYVHKRIIRTPQYLELLKKFPDWADVQPFVGAYESWVI